MRPIALVLLFGLLVPFAGAQDRSTLERLREQAWRGDAEAQLEMGILYEFGFGMPNNKAPALAWYRLAAEQGNAKAAARRDALRAGMTPPELEEAQRLYEQWRTKVPVAAGSPVPAP